MPLLFRTSSRGLSLIKSFEDFSAVAYLCPAKVWTIGYGHVIRKNEPHLHKATLTVSEAEAMLRDDCRTVETYLNAVLPDWIRAHHFDALVSFAFNVGVGAFDGSTLRVKLKAGDRLAAQAEFSKWVFAKGKRVRGLAIRRACEQLMFAGCSDNAIETERRRLESLKGLLS
ncbi:MAG: lysozyme [Zoogloea oleivorans]|jgi:lysozyme|uniref:lysozyme n=1 Tax=Zoogloea oleivorans TaxID=1552750 RepID=UPI002A36F710|nr:lysozyme [Zoogloea oleivorans]MDY0035431.1 lysozyme [Zoogloea oleivorans]